MKRGNKNNNIKKKKKKKSTKFSIRIVFIQIKLKSL